MIPFIYNKGSGVFTAFRSVITAHGNRTLCDFKSQKALFYLKRNLFRKFPAFFFQIKNIFKKNQKKC